jgi:hypothetical protein
MMQQRYIIFFSMVVGVFNVQAGVIPGDAPLDSHTTMINPIGSFAFDTANNSYSRFTLFIGAGSAVSGNRYAVGRLERQRDNQFSGDQKVIPMAPLQVLINNNAHMVSNPLCGAEIAYLAQVNNKPGVVTTAQNNLVHIIRNDEGSAIYSSPEMRDVNGQISGGILKFTGIESYSGGFFAAAVAACGSHSLSAIGGGISLVTTQKIGDNSGQENIVVCNANPYDSITSDNCPSPVNRGTQALAIGGDLTSLDITDMYWDAQLGRLLLAFNVRSGSNSNYGARAVAMGQLAGSNKLIIRPIAPSQVFTSSGDQIIGAVGSQVPVSIAKVRTMYTSTKSTYLIVVGGNGDSECVGNQVYAMPLVTGNSNAYGMLADVNQTPKNFRTFEKPALTSNDIFTTHSQGAQVGGGLLPLSTHQNVRDISVVGDTVYIAISDSYDGTTEPGIWSSQAIINNTGSIVAWTPWVRSAGTGSPVLGVQMDRARASFWYLTGTSTADINTIRITDLSASKDNLLAGTFDDQSVGLAQIISCNEYSEPIQIQGLKDFSRTTPGFDNVSLLVATSTNRVVIAETGRQQCSGQGFIPHTGDFKSGMSISYDGSLLHSSTGLVAIVQGGVLADLGPITTAAIATHGNDHWLVVGGINGLAVLADDNGYGWQGSINSLADLAALNLSFRMLKSTNSGYHIVRSLVVQDNNLFIMTYDHLDRVELTPASVKQGLITPSIIATLKDLGISSYGDFNDLVLYGPLALLATSKGLYRSGNGINVQIADGSNAVGWLPVIIPEWNGPVQQIFSISSYSGALVKSDLYLLCAYRGLNSAHINRFFVDTPICSNVTDSTIQPFKSDYFVMNKPSYVIDFGYYIDSLFMQGSLLFTSHCRDYDNPIFMGIINSGLYSESYFMAYGHTIIRSVFTPTEQFIGPMSQSSALGSIFFWGDGGLRVNE